MPRESLKVGSAWKSPFKCRLTVGGGFQYFWQLYEYTRKTDGSWAKSLLIDNGRNDDTFDLPYTAAADCDKKVLMWSVSAVFLDKDPMTVNVHVSVLSAADEESGIDSTRQVSRAVPTFQVAVDLEVS